MRPRLDGVWTRARNLLVGMKAKKKALNEEGLGSVVMVVRSVLLTLAGQVEAKDKDRRASHTGENPCGHNHYPPAFRVRYRLAAKQAKLRKMPMDWP